MVGEISEVIKMKVMIEIFGAPTEDGGFECPLRTANWFVVCRIDVGGSSFAVHAEEGGERLAISKIASKEG
jgi:hypothetical protein